MGHNTNPHKEYHLLQKKLDQLTTGAPDSPTFQKILALLFTPEEAGIASRLPGIPATLTKLADKTGIPKDELEPKLSAMAERGVLLDLEIKGEKYFFLPPVVIGFFEYTFMRAREDVPMKELAELFHTYMHESDAFAKAVFSKDTQIGRALIHEETIPTEIHSEILDWERAVTIIENASCVAVSTCACRHKAHHLGKACNAPMEVCLTLNTAADTMIRNGNAKKITNEEGLRILKECKELGLVQTGDNVQNDISYMCNCCSCCCGMIDAVNSHGIQNAIVSSNFIMEVDKKRCKGCGACISKCPVRAIELYTNTANRKLAACVEEKCLGCGVCISSCSFNALCMNQREKRVFTPYDVIDKTIAMAIERGKLTELVFDNPEKITHKILSRLLKMLEKFPPYQTAMAVKPLKSKFLNALAAQARKNTDL